MLGVYSKAEDTALSAAFGGQKRKRLNRVFDAVRFVYPDYRYPIRYVKNDLIGRKDIKEIIQRPIWSRFGLRRPKVAIEGDVKACQKAFSNVCAFIGTRDIVQEHIAYRVWAYGHLWIAGKCRRRLLLNPVKVA